MRRTGMIPQPTLSDERGEILQLQTKQIRHGQNEGKELPRSGLVQRRLIACAARAKRPDQAGLRVQRLCGKSVAKAVLGPEGASLSAARLGTAGPTPTQRVSAFAGALARPWPGLGRWRRLGRLPQPPARSESVPEILHYRRFRRCLGTGFRGARSCRLAPAGRRFWHLRVAWHGRIEVFAAAKSASAQAFLPAWLGRIAKKTR